MAVHDKQKRGDQRGRPVRVLGSYLVTSVALFVAIAAGVAACSADDEQAADTTTSSIAESAQDQSSDQAEQPQTTTADDAASDQSAPPASRADENPAVSGENHWIGRGAMTASSIELVWSPVIDATGYRIHRFEQDSGFDPEVASFDDAELVYDGEGSTVIDNDVVEGTFYIYILDVQMSDDALPRRWALGLARNDTTPPSPITNLALTSDADGVLLSWDPSTDDVEFASYAVSIVEGDQLRYIGGGGDPEVTSFLDTRPPEGVVTYSVQAVDFHDNRTEPVEIEFVNE